MRFKKLAFYVPVAHLEAVKDAVFATGAGSFIHYERQCWQVLGEGQFQPMVGANPFIGQVGAFEKVAEYRVEIYCPEHVVDAAVKALLDAHPYEGVIYEVVAIENTFELKPHRS